MPSRSKASRPPPKTAPRVARATPPSRASRDYTLTSLLAELRERAHEGESQDALVDWLYALTSALGIRMHYDEYPSGQLPEARARPAPPPPRPPPLSVPGPEAFPPLGNPPNAEAAPSEAPLETLPAALPAALSAALPEAAPEAVAPSPTPAEGPKKKIRETRVPVTVDHGTIVVQFFADPALQVRDPPASGHFSFLAENGGLVGRIILSCDRRNSRVDSPLCAECSGAVINAQTWTLLAVPPRAFAPRPSPKEIDRHLAADLYDIIQVSDGTVMTLYSWEHPAKGPVWCLATSNGYDVSPFKWMGEKPYAEILHELLAANQAFAEETGLRLLRNFLCEGDARLDFAGLDPGKCYTVGFRHNNFHPMGADPPGVWNIQAADLATGAPLYGEDSPGLPHIPRQAVFSAAGLRQLLSRPGEEPICMADLDQISRTALDEAKPVIAGTAPRAPPIAPSEGIHVSPFNYGFILRSRDPAVTGPLSDILSESPLLRKVRQLVYQRPGRQVRDELDHTNRLEYSGLKAYLTEADRADFIALFPEFKERFALYKQFLDNVIRMVVTLHRQNAMAPNTRTSNGEAPRTRITTVAKAMLTHICRFETDFRPFHADAASLVHDFVARPEYALLYLKAIGTPEPRG